MAPDDEQEPFDPGRGYSSTGVANATPIVTFDKGRDRGQAGATLSAWLQERTGAAHVDVHDVESPTGAGISNETILFEADVDDGTTTTTEHLVLRVCPEPEKQMMRDTLFATQARLLQLIHGEGLARVPDVRWYEDDPRWFGRPFFVMERSFGRVPVSEPVYNAAGWLFDATPAERRVAWERAMDEMIRLHHVPPDLVRFLPGGTGDGSAFLRVLDLVRTEYAWARDGSEHPIVDRLWDWLEVNIPPAPPDGLSWGDARMGNMMFDDDFRLVVVMDWELVSLGGSILDLGWWLFFDDVHSHEHPRLDGLGTRQETIDRWEAGTGLRADHVGWYEILAAVRLATIVVRATSMYGLRPDDRNVFVRLAYRRLGWDDPT